MRAHKAAKFVGLISATLLVATACGGGTDPTTPAGTTDAPTSASAAPTSDAPSGDPFKVGYILPETGTLAFLGPPQAAGVKYAIQLINEAGGVLGQPIADPVAGDEADDAAIVSQSADRLISEGVDLIVGAAASGRSLDIIDKVTGAGIAQCSGSNTAPTFTDYKDDGLYFRTAPSDALQGPVLAETILEDGKSKIAIVGRADDYGKGLANATAKALETSGASVVLNDTYDPKATDYGSVVQKIVAQKPDGVVVVAFEEGVQVIRGLIEAGLKPPTVGIYSADGMNDKELATKVNKSDPSVLDGMKGTVPAPPEGAASDYFEALKKIDPSLENDTYGAQVSDCVIIMALAAEKAKSTDANVFKTEVVNVTRDGEKCTSYADCLKLIKDGKDIDYDGFSGPVDMIDVGELGEATIMTYGFDNGGQYKELGKKKAVLAQ